LINIDKEIIISFESYLIYVLSFSNRPKWHGRDKGLTIRMIFSMVVLAILYVVFFSILSYFGLGPLPLVIIASVMILSQWFFSDKIVLWSAGAKIVSKDQYPTLHVLVERIVLRNNMPKPRVAVINRNIPNAFATGKGPGSSIVAVTTGLMEILDVEELEGVLAHELSHIKNRDVLVLTLTSLFSTIAWYTMQFGFYGGVYGSNDRDRNNSIAILVVLLVSVVTWIVSFIIIRAISRYREFAADRGAAQMTGKPSKLASALMKISGTMSKFPKRDLRQVEGLNAFFIVPALSGNSISNLFATHPSIELRITKLMELEGLMS
jgi:heat shock protein HtpX